MGVLIINAGIRTISVGTLGDTILSVAWQAQQFSIGPCSDIPIFIYLRNKCKCSNCNDQNNIIMVHE